MISNLKGQVVLVVLLLAASALTTATASATTQNREGSDPCLGEPWESFRVRTISDRARYQIGDTARFTVTVERDLRASSLKAQGVDVLVYVEIDDRYLAVGGETNGEGIAELKLPLNPLSKGGKADVYTYAWQQHGPHCFIQAESGHQTIFDLFLVRRPRT